MARLTLAAAILVATLTSGNASFAAPSTSAQQYGTAITLGTSFGPMTTGYATPPCRYCGKHCGC